MKQLFSQRIYLKPDRRAFQVNSMDKDLRKALWNELYHYLMYDKLKESIRVYYFKELIDKRPRTGYTLSIDEIRIYFFKCKWYEVYDLMEFVADSLYTEFYDKRIDTDRAKEFVKACNAALERELSAYRFIGNTLVQLTSAQEIWAVEEALRVSEGFTPHLVQAYKLLADRNAPDYRNSIKESISAVEAICKLITGDSKATLGKALERLEKSQKVELHEKLKNAFKNLYGYTSEAQGIRHALLGEADLDIEDAIFMLIACSAFINYLVAKAEKANIQLS